MIQIKPVTDLQDDYNTLEKNVLENGQTVYLTKNGYGAMVMLSLENYSKLVEEAEWQEVENMIINQPEESVKGDKYVLLLRKVDGNEETIDAQFLTAYDDYEPNVITEQVVKEETAKLPITSDSIVLFVVLGIVVIALVVIFIRIKVLSKKENNK